MLKKMIQGSKGIFKTTFSKVFIFANLAAVVFGSTLVMVGSSLGYEENFLICIADCIPLYLIAVIAILVFFMYRPEACGVFVLPIAYLLLTPLYFCALYIFGPLLSAKTIGIDTWVFFLIDRFNFFVIPLIVITLGMAICLNLTASIKVARGGAIPLLLLLRKANVWKKIMITGVSVFVVVVLEYIFVAMATM